MKYDPWQLLLEIVTVLIMLCAACLLTSSCDFHDCVNSAQCLLLSQVWVTGMNLPSGLHCDFRLSRPLSQLASLLSEPGCLAVLWNPAL